MHLFEKTLSRKTRAPVQLSEVLKATRNIQYLPVSIRDGDKEEQVRCPRHEQREYRPRDEGTVPHVAEKNTRNLEASL